MLEYGTCVFQLTNATNKLLSLCTNLKMRLQTVYLYIIPSRD